MKIVTYVILFIISIFILVCGQNSSKDRNVASQNDSELDIDSLRFDKALKDAISMAEYSLALDSFSKQYEFYPDDSSFTIYNDVIIGNLFGDKQKYCLLRSNKNFETHFVLYKVHKNKMVKLVEREQPGIIYIRDTIFDVNGDEYKDFVIHRYSASGYCRRNIYSVYLNQAAEGYFTSDYEFMNPTFAVKDKIIRGVEYGHPGEAGLYKYKWNGLKVDTIEYIYHDVLIDESFIKTKKSSYRPTKKEGVVLNAVPEEYHHIDDFEWFMSN